MPPTTALDHEIDRELHHLLKWYRRWRYHNSFLLIASIALFILLLQTNYVDMFVLAIGRFGYLGAALAGLFFVSTFTVAPAAVLLFHFAEGLNPFYVAVAASIGAVLGDYIIFQLIKSKISEGFIAEFRQIFHRLGGSHFSKLHSTPLFGWLAPVIGAIFIASPLPNEVGIGLLGISHLKHWQMLALSGALNSLGIFIIVFIAAAV